MDVEDAIKKIIEKSGFSREQIKQEIDNQIEELSGLIDEEGALLIVAKNLGIDLKENQEAANMETDQPINLIKPSTNVSIIGRIIQIGESRQYNKKDGTPGSVLSFVLQDKSSSVRCILWDQNTEIKNESGFRINEIVRILNGYTKEGRSGGMEVHIGNRSKIQLSPDEYDASLIPSLSKDSQPITLIKNLTINIPSVNIEGIITNIFPAKSFISKTGMEGKRASLSIADDSGITYITFWNDLVDEMENLGLNQKVRISFLNTKQNFRDKTKIDLVYTSQSEIQILDTEVKINSGKSEIQIKPIKLFTENSELGSIEGKVIEVENIRTVNLRDGSQKNVMKFIIADESASISINLWGDQIIDDLKVDDVLQIQGLNSRMNNYSKQMEGNLIRMGLINKIQKQINSIQPIIIKNTINSDQSSKNHYDSSNRNEIVEIKKDDFYEIKGSMVKEIKNITIYESCSKCFRKIDNCTCNEKNPIENRMIVNLLLDDETDTIRGTLMGERAEKFLKETTDRIKEIKDSGELDQFLKIKNLELLGTEYIFRGKAKYSQYSQSFEININYFELLDPIKESQRIINLIESR